MEHCSLVAFLDGSLDAAAFGSEIADEVQACVEACASGRTSHIIITDGPQTEVARSQVITLLEAVKRGELTVEKANYVADALIMSDDFSFADDAVIDAIYFLSDDSGLPTADAVAAELARLKHADVDR